MIKLIHFVKSIYNFDIINWKGYEEVFLDSDNLVCDLVTDYIVVFNLRKFSEMYSCDLCFFVCIVFRKKFTLNKHTYIFMCVFVWVCVSVCIFF